MMSKLLSSFVCLAKKSNQNFKPFTRAFFSLLMLAGVTAHAQVSSYTQSSTTIGQSYTPLVGVAVFGTPAPDNQINVVPFNFPFVFNGKRYTYAYASANGFLAFNNSLPAGLGAEMSPISSTSSAYEGVICAYARDLKPANLDALRATSGTAPNRVFTIQWTMYRGTANAPINMQILLYETTNVIEIKYNTATTNVASLLYDGQVGLRGESNVDFNNFTYTATNVNWPTGSPVFARGTTNDAYVNTKFNTAGSVRITTPTTLTFTPPACMAPRQVTITPLSITSTSATVNWVWDTPAVPDPANGYQYLVSTTAPTNINVVYPLAGTAPTGSVGTGVTSTGLSGLSPNTTYYVYVRSNCGTTSGWSVAGSFATLCNPYTVMPAYTQNFESGVTTPGIPNCNKVETLGVTSGTTGYWYTADGTIPDYPGVYNFPSKRVQSNSYAGGVNNTTYFIEGLQLTGGVSYRLSYTYGAADNFATTEHSMKVSYYASPNTASANTPLADHPIIKSGPYTNVINFTAPSTGTYYIGFNDYTRANQETLFLDDIDVRETVCFPPTGLTASGLTSGSATINWTAAAPPPTGGYEYYLATAPFTAPTSGTTPTGTVGAGVTTLGLGGLSPNTTYQIWIRSNCGGGDFSNWSTFLSFTTLMGPAPPSCVPSGAGYFQDPNGITNVTFSNVNNTTGIEPNNYGDYSYLTGYAGQGTTLPVSITFRTGWAYDIIIWVDWNNDGDFVDAGEQMWTGFSTGTSPSVVNASFVIPNIAGYLGAHRMRIGGRDYIFSSGTPLTPCRTGTYQAFEDYTLWVTTPPLPFTLSTYTGTVCAGDTVPVSITSTLSNYDSYTWTPSAGVTGTAASGYTLAPTTTTTYTIEAVNSVTFTRASRQVVVTVKTTPTAVTISPASTSICQNATTGTALTASGGIINNVPIFSEDFNGTAPGWTQTNGTTGSATAFLAAWGLFPDGYNPFLGPFHSNDNSQFAFTESDAPGSGSPNPITRTTLLSPAINLTGYTAATLSLWEHYDYFNGPEFGIIEVTTNAGGSWTTLLTHTSDYGTRTNFQNTILDLTPYVNNTIQIRFRYQAEYDWGWAIDNVSITGSGPTAITWAPTAGLYTDAAHTIAYTGGAASTVYAWGTSNNYVATAAFNGCSAVSAPAAVTITPISGGTLAAASQSICAGEPAADIVANSITGPVSYWQYATNAAFTLGVTNIPGSAGVTTLTSALIGSVTATRYYRAVVSVGGCSNAYSPVHTINVPTTTFTAPATWSGGLPTISKAVVFNGNYTVTSNMSFCSIQVNSPYTLTINPGVTITVQNAVNVAVGANMVFQNNASLVQVNNAANSGDIIYNRNTTPMRAYDYTYWSSPVNAQILAKLSPGTLADKYFWFNTGTYQWTSIAAPGSTPMTVGRGYIIRAPQSFNSTPTVFSTYFGFDGVTHGGGVPNNGNIVVPVGKNSATQDLDCIGNPYPSAVSADLFLSDPANTAALGAGTTIYFWTHNTAINANVYTPNDYASYNYTGGTGTGSPAISGGTTPNGNIAAGQGFMIKVANTGNVTFKNSMRLTGVNNQFFRINSNTGEEERNAIQSLQKNRMWLDFKNDAGMFKQTLIGYIEGATDGIDPGYDGTVVEAGNPVNFYSIGPANTKLTIQGRALDFNESELLPVGYRANNAGVFEISLSDSDGFLATQEIYIEDLLLNVIHDLRQSSYSFTTEAGTFDSRFVIRYTTEGALATTAPIFSESGVVVYKKGGSIFVETANIEMATVKVLDLRGREITMQKDINASTAEIKNLNVAQQVLLVQVTSRDNITVTKKIVY